MSTNKTPAAAIEQGRRIADEILNARTAAREHRARVLDTASNTLHLQVQALAPNGQAGAVATLRTAGFLVAAGDSEGKLRSRMKSEGRSVQVSPQIFLISTALPLGALRAWGREASDGANG
jgi:hypothetical protein